MGAECSKILRQVAVVDCEAYEWIRNDYVENGTIYDEKLLTRILDYLKGKKVAEL